MNTLLSLGDILSKFLNRSSISFNGTFLDFNNNFIVSNYTCFFTWISTAETRQPFSLWLQAIAYLQAITLKLGWSLISKSQAFNLVSINISNPKI